MQFTRIRSLLLAAVIGIVGLMTLIELMDVSPALAYAPKTSEAANPAPPAQPPPPKDDWPILIVFTDPAEIDITDLSRNPIGTAVLEGEVRCNGANCSQKATLAVSWPFTDPWSLEYKFTSRQALDATEQRVVVAGTGTIEGRGQKERFSFVATFENNRDGTVWAKFEASRPDASFIIARTRATFTLFRR